MTTTIKSKPKVTRLERLQSALILVGKVKKHKAKRRSLYYVEEDLKKVISSLKEMEARRLRILKKNRPRVERP